VFTSASIAGTGQAAGLITERPCEDTLLGG
jgi:hypothetical protein